MLEIFVLTFNRLTTLKKTVEALLCCDLAHHKITIIDNCSTDGTGDYIYNIFLNNNPNRRYVKNKVNIGAAGSLMRAYEMATEEYIWILCDDDEYDFINIEETILNLKNNTPDIMIVGTPVPQRKNSIFTKWPYLKLPRKEIIYLVDAAYCCTFLPAAIISRSKLQSCSFRDGYQYCGTYFPHMFWIKNIFDEDWSVQASGHIHISRPPIDHGLTSDFQHMNGYIESCRLIENNACRNALVNRLCGKNLFEYAIFISKKIIKDSYRSNINSDNIIKHFQLVGGFRRVVFSLIALVLLSMPNVFRNMIYRLKK